MLCSKNKKNKYCSNSYTFKCLNFLVFSLIVLLSLSVVVSAQSVPIKITKVVQSDHFDINNPTFDPSPSFVDGVPTFSNTPNPVNLQLLDLEIDVEFDGLRQLSDLSNDEFADLIIGEGVFERPSLIEKENVREDYKHVVSGFTRNELKWEKTTKTYYFYEIENEDDYEDDLFEELTRRLEEDSDFLNNYFNYDYVSQAEDNHTKAKGSEMIRRKFWEYYGIYDHGARCTVTGQSKSRKNFVDYFVCVENMKFDRGVPVNYYLYWRTRISTDEQLQNIIRLSYYDSLLDRQLLNKNPDFVSYANQIDSVENIYERLKKADDLSGKSNAFLTIEQMRDVLGELPYDAYERLRIGAFTWVLLNEDCEDSSLSKKDCDAVSLAGVHEDEKGQVKDTYYGVRNYAFNLENIDYFILLVANETYKDVPSDEDVLARARIKFEDYNVSAKNPFSNVFSPLIKTNYPLKDEYYPFNKSARTIKSQMYGSNYHNESFTFFSDARVKSVESGVVTIQDKYLDPVVFSSSGEFNSKSVEDVRSISFSLENFKDVGAGIRSGSESSKESTGCLRYLGKDYCDGLIDISYSESISRFGEFQKVLNVEGVDSFNLDEYDDGSLLVKVKGTDDNPVRVSFKGREMDVKGSSEFKVSSASSLEGMSDASFNSQHRLGELNVDVKSGSLDLLKDGVKFAEFSEQSEVTLYSLLESQGTNWEDRGDAGTLHLNKGSMKTFNSDGIATLNLDIDEGVFVDTGEPQGFDDYCASLKVDNCENLLVPEVLGGSDDIGGLLSGDNFKDDLDVNFISLDNDKLTSYFSNFDGEFRTGFDSLESVDVFGNVNTGTVGFIDGEDVFKNKEVLAFTNSNFEVDDSDDLESGEFLKMSSSPSKNMLIDDKKITWDDEAISDKLVTAIQGESD